MKVRLEQQGSDALFRGKADQGEAITIHSPLEDGQEKKGPSPMESLLLAAAACTSVDVIMILKKMKQPLKNLSVDVEGERVAIDDAKPFREIDFTYNIVGKVDQKKAERSVALAIEKYCSVLESLHPDIGVTWNVVITQD